ncbi:dihydroxyacetone kinase subunit DhaL [Brevibacillus sp. B_LB10_24]|uniref:dihydroxyacetone kinase subunit DhaL n=1 Tax=Brevibacillus sp. B_LB10_24 TaxID=3380645 RepID=UPI0038B92DC9
MHISFQDFKQIFVQIANQIEQQKEYLSELDRALGDGDHGISMSLGWKAVVAKLETLELGDCGSMCKEMALSFLNAVGASVGPLYATAFLRGSAVLQGKSVLTKDDVVGFWVAAVGGILERGNAQIGDKTMIDTWLPAIEGMKTACEAGKELDECLQQAVLAGEQGMKSTKDLQAKKGRSSKLGERALGHQDPGATSAYLILSTFYACVKSLKETGRIVPPDSDRHLA